MIIQCKWQIRFEELDLIDRVPEELWTEVPDIVHEAVIETIHKKRKWKKAKWLSEEGLQIASLLFSAIFKSSLDNHFALLQLFFLGMVLISASCTMSWTSIHVLQAPCLPDLISWIYFSLPLYNCEGFDLGHTWMVKWFFLLSSI